MQYIEAVSNEEAKHASIFLAGGITNCADWQAKVTEDLKDIEEVTIFNPRRKDFDVTDKNAEREQITWEYKRLREADIILFWFTAETLNPIVLFEYGSALERISASRIVVGVHPDYQRKSDVEIQTSLRNKNIKIHYDLESVVEAVRKALFVS